MATSYAYSLGAKALSEFIGMTLTIFFGESIIANELLPSTKGHGMGFLAVAFGFGLGNIGLGKFWASFFLLQSWIPDESWVFAYNSVAWTLCVEAFF